MGAESTWDGVGASCHLAMEPQLNELTTMARTRVSEIDEALTAARLRLAEVDSTAGEAKAAIERLRSELKTSATQAGLLITTVLSDATNALVKADAERNTKESRCA